MKSSEQLRLLKTDVEGWNKWRRQNPKSKIDLRGADLHENNLVGVNLSEADISESDFSGADLSGADFTESNLRKADLFGANLFGAYLSGADLTGVNLSEANLSEASLNKVDLTGANLSRANLSKTYFWEANFHEADLSGSDLSEANLTMANFIEADLSEANLSGADLSYSNLLKARISNAKISKSKIYGVNVWDLEGEFKDQKELIITPEDTAAITVDNIEIAQFIYLILNNKRIRDVINTLTSKTVLILGRFALRDRKIILDALRDKLREYDLLPIVFDFDRPTDKDFTETIKTLAGISYFVIADVTNPKSSPLELQATVPDYQIPFVPIIQEGESPFAMMVDLQKKYPWVLPTKSYDSIETLMKALKPGVIDPAVEMRNKLRLVKAQEQETESLKDYLNKTL
jgi:uncharacterized protein YjbI with pentapeptide repeats